MAQLLVELLARCFDMGPDRLIETVLLEPDDKPGLGIFLRQAGRGEYDREDGQADAVAGPRAQLTRCGVQASELFASRGKLGEQVVHIGR